MTKELPTKPGAYWWQPSGSPEALQELCLVFGTKIPMVEFTGKAGAVELATLGGCWSPRLVTCDKLKDAYNEGNYDGGGSGGEKEWNRSDTKDEMEGNE